MLTKWQHARKILKTVYRPQGGSWVSDEQHTPSKAISIPSGNTSIKGAKEHEGGKSMFQSWLTFYLEEPMQILEITAAEAETDGSSNSEYEIH